MEWVELSRSEDVTRYRSTCYNWCFILIVCLYYLHFFSTLGDPTLYNQLKEHVLTKALLRENNYPHKHPDKAGFAILYGDTKKGSADGGSSERIFLKISNQISRSSWTISKFSSRRTKHGVPQGFFVQLNVLYFLQGFMVVLMIWKSFVVWFIKCLTLFFFFSQNGKIRRMYLFCFKISSVWEMTSDHIWI